MGNALSYVMFDEKKVNRDETWKFFLSDEKPMCLDLNYHVGEAYIDLSGLAIERMKLKSGSANVHLLYGDDEPNKDQYGYARTQSRYGRP